MKIGLFGGSFDPPHLGHVAPVKSVLEEFGLERIFYLPTACPPHKPDRRMAPDWARMCMVELALLDEERLFVSDHELTPGRPAYTVDTLHHFASQQPEAQLHLILGSDSFALLDRWVRWREIAAASPLIVLDRPGWSDQRLRSQASPDVVALLDEGRARLASEAAPDVSSTGLRELLARGDPLPAGAIAASVLTYIRKYSLYR